MKKRARIVSGLAALAAFCLAPLAEASITRSSAPDREAPAPELTLAAPEPSEFSLFDGTEIARALASRPALISISTDEEQTSPRTRFVSPSELSADELPNDAPELLPITSVREQRFNLQIPPNVFGLEPLRGPPGDEASYPKTRYRVFGLLGTPILGEMRGVSLELHWRSASFSCGLASGTVGWLSQDPLGDADSVNLYGFVRMRPHEFTDPLGLITYTKSGGANYLGNAGDVVKVTGFWSQLASAALDAVGNTVSDLLMLDTIAESSIVAGDSSRSGSERAWAATKGLGAAAFDVAGGEILGTAGKILTKVPGVQKIVTAAAKTKVGRVLGSDVGRLIQKIQGKAPSQLGKGGEALAAEITGVAKNTESFTVNGRTRIPDQVHAQDIVTKNPSHVSEIKNVKRQSLTRQLRDDVDLVGPGGRVDVYLPPEAKVTKPLQRAFDDPTNPLNRVDLVKPGGPE